MKRRYLPFIVLIIIALGFLFGANITGFFLAPTATVTNNSILPTNLTTPPATPSIPPRPPLSPDSSPTKPPVQLVIVNRLFEEPRPINSDIPNNWFFVDTINVTENDEATWDTLTARRTDEGYLFYNLSRVVETGDNKAVLSGAFNLVGNKKYRFLIFLRPNMTFNSGDMANGFTIEFEPFDSVNEEVGGAGVSVTINNTDVLKLNPADPTTVERIQDGDIVKIIIDFNFVLPQAVSKGVFAFRAEGIDYSGDVLVYNVTITEI